MTHPASHRSDTGRLRVDRVLGAVVLGLLAAATVALLAAGFWSQEPVSGIIGLVITLGLLVYARRWLVRATALVATIVPRAGRVATVALALALLAAWGVLMAFRDYSNDAALPIRQRGSWMMAFILAVPAVLGWAVLAVGLWRERRTPEPGAATGPGAAASRIAAVVAMAAGPVLPALVVWGLAAQPGSAVVGRMPAWLVALPAAAGLHVLAKRAGGLREVWVGVLATLLVGACGVLLVVSLPPLDGGTGPATDWPGTLLGPVLALTAAWGAFRFGRRLLALVDGEGR